MGSGLRLLGGVMVLGGLAVLVVQGFLAAFGGGFPAWSVAGLIGVPDWTLPAALARALVWLCNQPLAAIAMVLGFFVVLVAPRDPAGRAFALELEERDARRDLPGDDS